MSKYYVGIDLHKAIVQVCVLDAGGSVVEERRLRVAGEEDGVRVLEFLAQWAQEARYVVEAVGCDRWFVNAAS